jgi:hypothetical protein
MKKVLFVVAILLCAAGLLQAQNGQDPASANQYQPQGTAQPQASDKDLHGSVAFTYMSKNVWRGFNLFGSMPGMRADLNLDFWGSGFGMQVQDARPFDGENKDAEWIRYYLFYDNVLAPGDCWQTNYRIGYMYYNFPQHSWKNYDLQELHAILAWPKVLGVEGLVPSYTIVKMWPSQHDQLNVDHETGGTPSAFAHILALDYAWNITCPLTNKPRAINLHSEAVYNDGVGPMGQNVDHDWSDVVFGASTDFDLAKNFVFTPGLFYQISMDESVNSDDQLWTELMLKYKF